MSHLVGLFLRMHHSVVSSREWAMYSRLVSANEPFNRSLSTDRPFSSLFPWLICGKRRLFPQMSHSVGLTPQMRHSLVSFHEWAMHSWSLSANEPFRRSLIVAQLLCRPRKAAREAMHFWTLLRCLSVSRSLSITAGLFPAICLFPQIGH